MTEAVSSTQRGAASLSVIVPAFENPQQLEISLNALARSSSPPLEVIVVDDGSRVRKDEIAAVCERYKARYVRLERNLGPASARNAGAKASSGSILVFLDADVAVHPETLQEIRNCLEERPDLDAVFGAYDDRPSVPGTVSQFRNLLHHYIHLQSAGKANTFWAGCGAIRRPVFEAACGFPESYPQPSIEDVELGRRLTIAGSAIELDPSIQVTHVKHWTLWSMFRTDLFQRAAPWTEIFWEWGGLPRRLNFGWVNRLCVMLAGAGLVGLAMRWPVFSLFAGLWILALNIPIYRFIASRLGARALPASVAAHLVHFCAAFLGILLGSWRFFRKRDPAGVPVGLCLLLLAGILQLATGAYTADFAAHPDESGHFVTSVMVSRFLDQPFQNPMLFAQRAYLEYPKVAIGHWPPLGYVLMGFWMRDAGVGRTQALLLILLFSVIAALLMYELLWPDIGRRLAIGAALVWLAHDSVQRSYQEVMMDIPVVMLCLLALAVFRQYITRPGRNAALGFGFLAALALLVKANAIVLAFVPPCYVLLSRRWNLLRRIDFWLAALPVALIAGPWYGFSLFYFYRNAGAWAGLPRTVETAWRFPWALWLRMSGVPLLMGSLAGLGIAIKRARRSDLLWGSVLMGSVAADAVVRAMGEPRHLLLALAAMVALSFLAISGLPKSWGAVLAAMLLVSVWHWTPAPHLGYHEAAVAIDRGPSGNVLLSGPGDGAVIASAAALQPDSSRQRLWLRADKLMGNVTWSGRVLSQYFTTRPEVASMLDRYGIDQVYLDPPREDQDHAFDLLLRETLRTTGEWQSAALPDAHGGAQLFRRIVPVPATRISLYVPRLGRSIESDMPAN